VWREVGDVRKPAGRRLLDLNECGWCRDLGNGYQTTHRYCPDASKDHRHLISDGFSFGQVLYSSHHCNMTHVHSFCALVIFITFRTLLHSRLDAEFLSELSMALGKDK